MIKSASLLIATNFAVVIVLGGLMTFLINAGILPPGMSRGFIPMVLMALVMGFGGAAFSLFMSKTMAKRSTRARVITQPANEMEQWLVSTVQRQAEAAGIKMPEVAIYDSNTMNAFATGPSKNNSLVAVSTGLMNGMSPDEVEGVLAHEVSHAANGDMVSMTLMQGVTNTFVIVLSQVLGGVVDSMIRGGGNRRGPGPASYLVRMVLNVVFGFLAAIIVKWFSRHREFRADEGAAQLAGADKMIAALQRLQSNQPPQLPASMAALGIAGGGRLGALMSTHPPLEKRIEALRARG